MYSKAQLHIINHTRLALRKKNEEMSSVAKKDITQSALILRSSLNNLLFSDCYQILMNDRGINFNLTKNNILFGRETDLYLILLQVIQKLDCIIENPQYGQYRMFNHQQRTNHQYGIAIPERTNQQNYIPEQSSGHTRYNPSY